MGGGGAFGLAGLFGPQAPRSVKTPRIKTAFLKRMGGAYTWRSGDDHIHTIRITYQYISVIISNSEKL